MNTVFYFSVFDVETWKNRLGILRERIKAWRTAGGFQLRAGLRTRSRHRRGRIYGLSAPDWPAASLNLNNKEMQKGHMQEPFLQSARKQKMSGDLFPAHFYKSVNHVHRGLAGLF